jgi:hypothetical protein
MAMRPRSGIWIRLAVEELAWLDSDDFAAAEALQAQGVPAEHALASMVVRATNDMPDDDLDMAQRLIGRVEQVFEDPRQADLYLACLSLTRSGLSSDDLSTIVGADPRVTARARWILGGQLTQRDESGRLTIDHPLVLEAARSHIPSAGGHREVHNRLASHMRALAQPTSTAQGARDSIAWADLLWHAMLAGDSTIALSVLDDPAPLSPAELGGIVSSAIIAGRTEGAPALKVVEELSERRLTSPWWHPLLLAFVAELNGRTPAENLTMGRVVHQAVWNPDAGQAPGAWVGALVDVQLAECFGRIRDYHTSRVLALAAFERCADAESWAGSPPEARDMSSALALLALSQATLPLGNNDEAQAAAAGAERAASRLTASMSNDCLAISILHWVAFVINEKATDARSREDSRMAEQRCRSACRLWRSRYGSEIGESPSTVAMASSVMQTEIMMAATGEEDPGDMAQIVDDARRWLSVLPEDLAARKMLIMGLLYRSWAERENNRPAEARLALEEAEGLVHDLLEMDPDDLESESLLADVCNQHGEQLLEIPLRLKEFEDEALRWFQQGLDHNRRLARANPTDRWATARVLESLLHVIKAAVPTGNARVAQIACGELETLSSEWVQVDPLGVEARESRYLAAFNRSWVLQEFSFEDRDARRAAHARLIAAIDALGEVSELDESQQEERSQSLAALRALEQPTPSPMAGTNASFVGPSAASTGMTASHRLGALVDAEPNCGGRDAVLNLIHLMLSWPALPRKLRKRYGVLHMRDRKELGLTIMDLRGYEHPTPIDWDHWDAAVNALDERLPNLGGVVRRAIRAGVADWEEIAGYLDLPGHDG